jgi:hypothetical protein
MAKMYELTAKALSIYNRLQDEEADLVQIQFMLAELDGEIADKATSMVRFVQMLDADTDAISAEIKRLQDRKKARENRADGIKAYLKAQMEMQGKDKIQTPLLTISIQKNSQPSLIVEDVSKIPASYQVVKYDLNNAKIKEDLQKGQEVPGCKLVQGNHLRIR